MFKEKTAIGSDKIGSSATLISAGTILHGDVKSENDLRIDGTIHGNVTSSSKIVVGPSGQVKGNINGKQADVTGKVTGDISVTDLLQLRAQSNVQGNIHAGTLQVDPSAIFNGQCKMGAVSSATGKNVVIMSKTDGAIAEAK
ncbi:MAG TPA: polymer-forming cytoskeletal protein [Flavisolibacter sp.]|jgi:cytoskeletal protein CcmA (bactofilin family)|nr:polymer-forming cytoskeletal protein [Flavisolibacter sp.]